MLAVQEARSAVKAEMHQGGLISYGAEDIRWLFSSFGNVRGGANMVCTILLFFLHALKTSDSLSALASLLLLHVDGGSENINRYVPLLIVV